MTYINRRKQREKVEHPEICPMFQEPHHADHGDGHSEEGHTDDHGDKEDSHSEHSKVGFPLIYIHY